MRVTLGWTINSGNFVTSGNSTDTVTLTGTKAQLNALLNGSSSGTIVYYHDQTAGSDAPSSSTTITLTVNDQGNTGSDPGTTGDASSEEHSASQTINITSINDSPDLLGPNLIANGTFGTGLTGWATTGTVNGSFGRASFGGSNSLGPHSVSQTVATSVGETYVLEFLYRDDHGNLNQQLQVSVDGSSNLLTTEQIVTDPDGSSFIEYRFTFTADSTSTTVTFTDTSDDVGSHSASTFGVGGAIDDVTLQQLGGLLGSATYTEGGSAVVLDSDVTVFDAELDAGLDDFDGTTLTLVRNGGANSDDRFAESGLLGTLTETGNLVYNGSNIGTVTANSGGTLLLTFSATADATSVNGVLQSITYANTSDTPSSSVQIDWVFTDGNDGAAPQGSGGVGVASGHSIVNITATNDDPTNAGSLPSDVAVIEDVVSNVDLSSVDFSDVDASGSTLTVTLSTSTGGELTVAAGAGITLGGSSTARTFTGTSPISTTISTNATNIQYVHSTAHTSGNDADSITVVINDNGNTGSGGGADQMLGTVNLDITEVNDAPSGTDNTVTTTEDTDLHFRSQ